MTYVAGAWALLKRVPWQAWIAIALAVAFLLYGEWKHSQGYAKRDIEQAQIERKAAEQARKADSASRTATDTTKKQVEQSNDEARKAANGSDDPLGAGLDSLRRSQAGPNASTR